jgi:hypothetical protein
VQQRPGGAIHEGEFVACSEGAHVLLTQVELDTGLVGVLAGSGKHRRGCVYTDDPLPGGLSDTDRHPAVADRPLQDGAGR